MVKTKITKTKSLKNETNIMIDIFYAAAFNQVDISEMKVSFEEYIYLSNKA